MKIQRNAVLTALVSAVLVAGWSPVARAYTEHGGPDFDRGSALHKAGRGLAAITTPFLEIPGNIKVTTEEHGAPAGWTEGFAMGLGMTIIRPVVGVYELITAPFPAPEDYKPILKPEYPWSYFGSGDRSGLAWRR